MFTLIQYLHLFSFQIAVTWGKKLICYREKSIRKYSGISSMPEKMVILIVIQLDLIFGLILHQISGQSLTSQLKWEIKHKYWSWFWPQHATSFGAKFPDLNLVEASVQISSTCLQRLRRWKSWARGIKFNKYWEKIINM